MSRLAPLLIAAAVVLAGCASKAAQNPPPSTISASASFTDPRGDTVDPDGVPRHGRPDVDIVGIGIDRNAARTLFAITTAGAPRGPLRYEIFAQSPEVSGYDVVKISRTRKGLTGYVAFEDSVARQTLSEPQSLSLNGKTLAVNVPIDPIFGATPFDWRVSVSSAKGAPISDATPSATGTRPFPRSGGSG